MNAKRRKQIEKLSAKLEELMADLEAIQEEEQECFDNLPENFQYGEKGDRMQECIDTMDDVLSGIQDCIDWLNDVTDN